LSGVQTINGNLNSGGRVAPGSSPGILTINGDYDQTNTGVLEIEVAGTSPGTQHDQLVVTGTAALDGTLEIVSQAANLPGTTVQVVSANTAGTRFFNTETVSGNGIYFAPTYLPTGVNAISYLIGDMNRNGVRNTDDIDWFAKALTNPDGYWNSSATGEIPAGPACICIYGSSSGNVDGQLGLDFDDVDDFAALLGVSSSLVFDAINAVPEPTAAALLGMILAALAVTGRSRPRRTS
jgi:hypothetical protein